MLNAKGQLCKVFAKYLTENGKNVLMVYENPHGTFGKCYEFYINDQYMTFESTEADASIVFNAMVKLLNKADYIV